MKNSGLIVLLLILLFSFSSEKMYADQVDTLSVFSPKMQEKIKNIVIVPANYNQSDKKYPVIYLLHGYGANYTSWLTVVKKNLPDLATLYDCIIVCPDGKNSWYWDSPEDIRSQYETYISQELVHTVDSIYHTIPKNKGRAISGFSMGGHGALWLTINHPDVFGACGSMSGGVDIRPFPKNWEISNQLGDYASHKNVWDTHTVITQIDRIKGKNIPIIIDCGESDFFIDVNEQLHRKMLDESMEHTYLTSPGKHTPAYWRKSIDIHLQFFTNFFSSYLNL